MPSGTHLIHKKNALMSDFVNGWWYFWSAFLHSWIFVSGFAAASIVSTILYETLKALVKVAIIYLK